MDTKEKLEELLALLSKFASVKDPIKGYLAERKSYINKSNDKIKSLCDEIKSGFKEEKIIYVAPLQASVFYPGRTGSKHKILTVELRHNEGMQELEHRAVYSLSICSSYNKSGETGYFTWDRWEEFDDTELKFGSSVYFKDKNEYLCFKKIVTEMKELYLNS